MGTLKQSSMRQYSGLALCCCVILLAAHPCQAENKQATGRKEAVLVKASEHTSAVHTAAGASPQRSRQHSQRSQAAAHGSSSSNNNRRGSGNSRRAAEVTADAPTLYTDIFELTNKYRRQHNAEPLQWNITLAGEAAAWAGECIFKPDPRMTSGENIYAVNSLHDLSDTMDSAVRMWYKQSSDYNYKDPGFSMTTAAFTQMVWQSTTALGCAAQTCTDGVGETDWKEGTLVVCRYLPQGNYASQFEDNVFPVEAPGEPSDDPENTPPRKAPTPPRRAPPRTAPTPPKKDPTPPRKAPTPPHKQPTPPRKAPLPPREDPTPPRKAPTPPHKDPTPPRKAPTPPKKDPTPPRKAPTPPHKDPTPPRKAPTPPSNQPQPPRRAPGTPPTHDPSPPRKAPEPAPSKPSPPAVPSPSPETPIGNPTDNNPPAPTPGPKPKDPALDYILQLHNMHRKNHLANPLIWNEMLASGAAQQVASCEFTLTPSRIYGENIFVSASRNNVTQAFSDAMDFWYGGVEKYSFSDPGYHEGSSPFTQVVWRSTFALGCAAQGCSNGIVGTLVVCRYAPPGNQGTAFNYLANVKPYDTPQLLPPVTPPVAPPGEAPAPVPIPAPAPVTPPGEIPAPAPVAPPGAIPAPVPTPAPAPVAPPVDEGWIVAPSPVAPWVSMNISELPTTLPAQAALHAPAPATLPAPVI